VALSLGMNWLRDAVARLSSAVIGAIKAAMHLDLGRGVRDHVLRRPAAGLTFIFLTQYEPWAWFREAAEYWSIVRGSVQD
jgi:hypothetical protein